MDEASGEDGEDETGYELEQDAVKPEVEGEGVEDASVEPPVVEGQAVLRVAQPGLPAHPQARAQCEEDHVGDRQEERNGWKVRMD